MFKIGLNPNTLQQADLETFIQAAAKSGYDGVELSYPVIEKYLGEGGDVEGLKSLLRDSGLAPVSVNIESPFWQFEQGEVRKEALKRVRDCVRWSSSLGCGIVGVNSGLKEGSLGQGAEDLREVAAIAEESDIKIAFEFLGFSETLKDINTSLEMLKIAERDNCGLLVDSFHMLKGGSKITDLDQLKKEDILLVHANDIVDVPVKEMKDTDRVFPGEGIYPLKEFLAKITGKGYEGYITLEIFNEEYWKKDPFEIASRGYSSLREYLED